MKKTWKRIHQWLAVPVGLLFSVLCLSGAVLVFEDEITDFVYRDISRIEPQEAPVLSKDEITEAVARNLGESAEIKKIEWPATPRKAVKVSLRKPKGAACYINPYTGEITGDCSRLPFFAKTQNLHRWLLAPKGKGSIGNLIVDWGVLLAVFLVLSGFILWWPKSKTILASRVKISTKSARAFWYSLHVAGGFYIFLFLMIILLTGLTWAFPAWRNLLVSLLGDMSFKPLHTGAWLGIVGKILWFLTALIGAALPPTGFYFWIKRSLNAKKSGRKTV